MSSNLMENVSEENSENVAPNIKPSKNRSNLVGKNDSKNGKKETHSSLIISNDSDDESEDADAPETENRTKAPSNSRQQRSRKQVQRFSETMSKRYEDERAARDKFHDSLSSQLAKGSGTPLGDIPLIEASIRKFKPIDLKILHYACFGRAGGVAEVRSNLRKFNGLGFDKKADDYCKREQALNKKPVKELQTALRQLNLEVSGSRTQVVTRLLEFLLKPSSSMVKYKGKLPPSKRKSVRGRKPSSKEKNATSAKKRLSTPKSKVDEDAASDHEEISDSDAELFGKDSTTEEENSDSSGISSKKRKRNSGPRKSLPSKRRRTLIDSDNEDEDDDDNDESKHKTLQEEEEKKKKGSTDAVENEELLDIENDEDSDTPLADLLPPRAVLPSDEEIKTKVVKLLNTANFHETSMKAVRKAISEQYEGLDLTSKKQFINDVIKAYLSSTLKTCD